MTQVEMLQKVLEAALAVEDEETERLTDRGQVIMAREHFYRAGGIMYAIQLMVDPTYLKAQAEILEVLPRPARKAKPFTVGGIPTSHYDMSDEQAAEFRNERRRG